MIVSWEIHRRGKNWKTTDVLRDLFWYVPSIHTTEETTNTLLYSAPLQSHTTLRSLLSRPRKSYSTMVNPCTPLVIVLITSSISSIEETYMDHCMEWDINGRFLKLAERAKAAKNNKPSRVLTVVEDGNITIDAGNLAHMEFDRAELIMVNVKEVNQTGFTLLFWHTTSVQYKFTWVHGRINFTHSKLLLLPHAIFHHIWHAHALAWTILAHASLPTLKLLGSGFPFCRRNFPNTSSFANSGRVSWTSAHVSSSTSFISVSFAVVMAFSSSLFFSASP